MQEDDELASIMAAADLDGDGKLNYEEFIAATASLNKLEREANILAAFNQFDTDHSGALTRDEIREALASMQSTTDEEIQVRVGPSLCFASSPRTPWLPVSQHTWVCFCHASLDRIPADAIKEGLCISISVMRRA
jgi:hypothetical protein